MGTSLIRNSGRPRDPSVGLCLGPYGDAMGVTVSDERGIPVLARSLNRAASPITPTPPPHPKGLYRGS